MSDDDRRVLGSARTEIAADSPAVTGTGVDGTLGDGRASDSAPPRHEQIGRFSVQGTLGEGGMGVVLLAHDPTLDRRVALKLLRVQGDSSARVRLLREAQAMAKLRDPHVVTVYEAGTHLDQVFIAMEYIAGGTLRAWLSANRYAPWQQVLAKFTAAGRGLASAHRAQVVHRDFKPDNVLVDDTGAVKVGDFGLAARSEPSGGAAARTAADGPPPDHDALSDALTRAGDLLGTPRYMSPEHYAGEPTTPQSDQFSFCVALYEALFHQHPFSDGNFAALRAATLAGEVRPPPKSRGPRRVRDAVIRGLSRQPSQRFASMDELLAALGDGAPAHRSRLAWFARLIAIGLAIALAVTLLDRSRPSGNDADPPEDHRPPTVSASGGEDITVSAPDGATILGVRPVGKPPSADGMGVSGRFDLAEGAYVIDYKFAGARYAYGVLSHGHGDRSLTLPEPQPRDGYIYIPGGEIEIGDDHGAANEQPVNHAELPAFYIARTTAAQPMDYAGARAYAAAQHARLPSAVEWEWAARTGTIAATGDGWQWTSSPFDSYQTGVVVVGDPYADRARSEQRGGGATAASRRDADHRDAAVVRLAVDAVADDDRDTDSALVWEVETETLTGSDAARAMPADQRAALDRFLIAWGAHAEPRAIAVYATGDVTCEIARLFAAAGVPMTTVEHLAAKTEGTWSIELAPDLAYRGSAAALTSRSCD